MQRVFELVGMVVTLVGAGIGLRAMIAAWRPKPRTARLRMQPIAPAAPLARPQRRRRRQHATDPLEEVINLLVQVPVYLLSVVQTAHRTALEVRADYVAARGPALQKPAAEAAETFRNVPETAAETPPADVASDITTSDQEANAVPVTPTAEAIQLQVIAKLINAQVIKSETRALETVFDVNAGGGKEYQRLKFLLKAALAELEPTTEAVALTQQVSVIPTMPQRATAA